MPVKSLGAAGRRRWAVALLIPLVPAFCVAVRGEVLLAVPVFVALIAMEAHAFYLYGVDKVIAFEIEQTGQDRPRVSENALHWTEVLGGWPGASIAQRVFMHKTRKETFQVTYYAVVGLNLLAVGVGSYVILNLGSAPEMNPTVAAAERVVRPRPAAQETPSLGPEKPAGSSGDSLSLADLLARADGELAANDISGAGRTARAAQTLAPADPRVRKLIDRIEAARHRAPAK